MLRLFTISKIILTHKNRQLKININTKNGEYILHLRARSISFMKY